MRTPRQKSKTLVSKICCYWRVMVGTGIVGLFLVAVYYICKNGANKVTYNSCMDGMECLSISHCDGHEKNTWTCGDHDQVCCLPQVDNFTNVSTDIKMAKMALLPKLCGLRPAKDKIVNDKLGPRQELVANGINATIGEFPWMALLGQVISPILPLRYFCGGTIINKNYIMSAAHCISKPSLTADKVILGELNLLEKIDCEKKDDKKICADAPVIINVAKTIPHPMFNSTSFKHDIALLRLEHPIPSFTDYIQPICLPIDLKIDEDYLIYRDLMISGWGSISPTPILSTVLRQAHVRTSERHKCNEALQPTLQPINARQICAMGEDFKEACRCDSGGPLMDFFVGSLGVQYAQIGIISYKTLDTCGTEHVSTVFTNVSPYLNWILDTIED